MAKKLTVDEIRLRGLLLAKNKDLLQLHRDLVMSGMVSEDDFWETRKSLLENQEILLKQRRPPSTANLLGLDIKPQADIQGDLKFVLTPALIQSIFEQNPILKRAYSEKVPSAVDEKTFWMQYFTSKFFKEGLTASSSSVSDKNSPSGNILDEYYMESQRDQEGELALRPPTEKLPISIDILATSEDHFHAADDDARPADSKGERAKTATIRKLNKLSSNIVETSGIARFGESTDDMAELSFNRNESEDFLPLDLNESDIEQKRDVIVDEHHIDRIRNDWEKVSATPLHLLNYQEYSALMRDRRPPIDNALSDGQGFTESNLTFLTPEALQTYTLNMIELLRQFWSSYPPGSNVERQTKVTRMAGILGDMLSKLDRWVQSAPTAEEGAFLKRALKGIVKAAEVAISNAKPAAPHDLQSAQKRAKTN